MKATRSDDQVVKRVGASAVLTVVALVLLFAAALVLTDGDVRV